MLWVLRLWLLKSEVCTSQAGVAGASWIHTGATEWGDSQNLIISGLIVQKGASLRSISNIYGLLPDPSVVHITLYLAQKGRCRFHSESSSTSSTPNRKVWFTLRVAVTVHQDRIKVFHDATYGMPCWLVSVSENPSGTWLILSTGS